MTPPSTTVVRLQWLDSKSARPRVFLIFLNLKISKLKKSQNFGEKLSNTTSQLGGEIVILKSAAKNIADGLNDS